MSTGWCAERDSNSHILRSERSDSCRLVYRRRNGAKKAAEWCRHPASIRARRLTKAMLCRMSYDGPTSHGGWCWRGELNTRRRPTRALHGRRATPAMKMDNAPAAAASATGNGNPFGSPLTRLRSPARPPEFQSDLTMSNSPMPVGIDIHAASALAGAEAVQTTSRPRRSKAIAPRRRSR